MRYGSDQQTGRVHYKSADFTITRSGFYVFDSSAAVRTATLPALSAVGGHGFHIIVKRIGSNFVDVDAAGSDEFEVSGITTQRLFNDGAAISLRAHPSATDWIEIGFYGGILPS